MDESGRFVVAAFDKVLGCTAPDVCIVEPDIGDCVAAGRKPLVCDIGKDRRDA